MYKLLKDRINIKILCLSIVFAMISFFTDNIIFDKIQIQRQHYLTLKLIYVILIVCIGQLICKLVYAIKRSESVRTAVKFAGICFGILMVFLFLTYPGIWLWDNMEMLNMASTMKLSGWHGYYMQCFFVFALMAIPFPVGVNICQIIIIASVMGRIFYIVSGWIKNKKKRNIRAKKAKNKIDDKFHVLILGTGATGGIATSELLHLFNHHSNKIAQVVLMDGDHSESKNLRNQRFTHGDLGNFKVHSLCQRYSKAYKNIKISALPEYLYTLDNKELERIFKIDSVNDKNILIYSFVDNDATRKVCDSYYYGKESNVIKNLINFDSGNGMNDRSGQVFIGYKQYGKIIQDFIGGAEENEGEIRNNAEDISSIGTCTRVIEESPQHSSTNYMAAVETITSSIHLIKDGIIPCHYSFFDLQEGFMNTR